MQTGHIIEPLVLHVLGPSTHDIGHRGIGALQPHHQPLGTAVTLKGIASQVTARRARVSADKQIGMSWRDVGETGNQ